MSKCSIRSSSKARRLIFLASSECETNAFSEVLRNNTDNAVSVSIVTTAPRVWAMLLQLGGKNRRREDVLCSPCWGEG